MLVIPGVVQETGCLSTEQNPCIAFCTIPLSQDGCADLLLTIRFSTEAVTAACKTLFIQITWKQKHEQDTLHRTRSLRI